MSPVMRTDQARARLEAARVELTAIANDYFGAPAVIAPVERALADVRAALQALPSMTEPGQLELLERKPPKCIPCRGTGRFISTTSDKDLVCAVCDGSGYQL